MGFIMQDAITILYSMALVLHWSVLRAITTVQYDKGKKCSSLLLF